MNKTPPKTRMYHLIIFGGALIILVLGALWRGGGDRPAESSEVTAMEALKEEVSGVQSALSRNELEVIRDAVAAIPREVSPSVVAITPQAEIEEPFREISIYGMSSASQDELPEPTRSRGVSGVVLDKEGYILTSATVVQYEFPVQVAIGRVVKPADLISVDAAHHVAVIKLPEVPADLVPANFGKAAELKSGEWLVREGRTPSGDEARSLHLLESVHILSSGKSVGLLADEGTPYMDGSLLLNSSGNLVGLYVHRSPFDDFVVPIRRAVEIAGMLKSTPKTELRGWSGMELQELDAGLKEYFGATNGVLISSVQPDSPAAKAGLRPMDIIEKSNENDVGSPAEIQSVINQSAPGTRIPLTIKRNSRQQNVELSISELPGREVRPKSGDESLVVQLTYPRDGSEGAEISSIYPRASANKLGVKIGDVIVLVNGKTVRNPDQFWTFQRNAPAGKPQLWTLRRADKQFFVAVKEDVTRP